MVAKVAHALSKGQPTVFQFSASYHHGIRSGLCLIGWPWIIADLTAAAVVDRALKRLGATYPRWVEGQRDYAQMGLMLIDNCWNCGKPLLGELGSKYCSPVCRQRFHGHSVRPWLRYGDAYNSAVRMTRGLDVNHNG